MTTADLLIPVRQLARGAGRFRFPAAKQLARVWRMGNKPSRLRDNLAAMRRAAQEYLALSS